MYLKGGQVRNFFLAKAEPSKEFRSIFNLQSQSRLLTVYYITQSCRWKNDIWCFFYAPFLLLKYILSIQDASWKFGEHINYFNHFWKICKKIYGNKCCSNHLNKTLCTYSHKVNPVCISSMFLSFQNQSATFNQDLLFDIPVFVNPVHVNNRM